MEAARPQVGHGGQRQDLDLLPGQGLDGVQEPVLAR
jgi:hypothetical protein